MALPAASSTGLMQPQDYAADRSNHCGDPCQNTRERRPEIWLSLLIRHELPASATLKKAT